MATMEKVTLNLSFPSSLLCFGVSGAGKTRLIGEMIVHRDKLYATHIPKAVFFYSEYQPLYDEIKERDSNVEFTNDEEEFKRYIDEPGEAVLVVDDKVSLLMKSNQTLMELVLQKSHHNRKAVIIVTQNLYVSTARCTFTNCKYLVLFQNLRDKSTIYRLGYQLMPTNPKFPLLAYEHAVNSRPYGYLFISFDPREKEILRYRSNVLFWTSAPIYVYKPK